MLVMSYVEHRLNSSTECLVLAVDDWMAEALRAAAAFKFSPRDDTSTDTNLFRVPLPFFRLVAEIHITFIIIKSVRTRQSVMNHLLASFLRSQSSPPH